MDLPKSALAAAAVAALLWLAAPRHADAAAGSAGGAAISGVTHANLDTTCAPCKDFYRYATGGWQAAHPIPPANSVYGSFTEIEDQNRVVIKDVLDEAARNPGTDPTSNTWKLGVFYGTCMDSDAAEAAGAKPLDAPLAEIAGLKNVSQLAGQIGRMHAEGVGGMFRFGSEQDIKNSTKVIASVSQGGLGLPDRDYYTKEDPASQKIRDEYVAHIARTFQLLGASQDDATAQAGRVMAIETALAKGCRTRVQLRDPEANYHKMALADLHALTPAFDWSQYLQQVGTPAIDSVDVGQPDFFKALNGLLGSVPFSDWKIYLRWRVAADASPRLSSPFVNEDFQFQQLLSGAQVLQPRWKRCLQATGGALSEALGQEFVRRTFDPAAKARALDMVRNMETVLQKRLGSLDWMSEATRARAVAKLQAFTNKIGYPDRWRDYSTLKLERDSYLANARRAARFERSRRLSQIGKPVDRLEWGMPPTMVNAYYSSTMNEIVFPAAILQPPFFDPKADDALIYGGIGSVIGHEMTHGFDDQGRQFDPQGNLTNWWTPEDGQHFQSRASRVIEQFDGYTVLDSVHVNGKLTTGENIADLGGLAVAYAALEQSLAGKPHKRIDGFTPEQRFFLSYAQVWRQNIRPEAIRRRVNTDSHSPNNWRVNGPLSNLPEFAQAFGCKAGDAMVRSDSLQVRIW